MSLSVVATFEVVDGKRDAFIFELSRILPTVCAENGCLSYVPHTVGRNGVLVIESWESPGALQAHASADHMTRFAEAVAELLVSDMTIVVARPVLLEAARSTDGPSAADEKELSSDISIR